MNLKNRREFLVTAKSMVCSLLFLGIVPFSSFGKNGTNSSILNKKGEKSILILYASFHGSTAQIAEFMGKILNEGGIEASVKSINDDFDFTAYRGVIMGAPIHRGEWMDEAIEFVNKQRKELDHLLVACFYTCMAKAKQPPSKRSIDDLVSFQTAMSELFPNLAPSHIGSFAGMLDYGKCNFLTKLAMWLIMTRNNLEAGDYRNWKAIEGWLKKEVGPGLL